jgi:hypothetical protein
MVMLPVQLYMSAALDQTGSRIETDYFGGDVAGRKASAAVRRREARTYAFDLRLSALPQDEGPYWLK